MTSPPSRGPPGAWYPPPPPPPPPTNPNAGHHSLPPQQPYHQLHPAPHGYYQAPYPPQPGPPPQQYPPHPPLQQHYPPAPRWPGPPPQQQPVPRAAATPPPPPPPQQVQYYVNNPPATPRQYYPPPAIAPSPTPPARPPPPPEIAHVLVGLGETYLEAAHRSGPRLAKGSEEDKEAYYALVAAGLRALETALLYRLQPRAEALVRLRYATVLFEETENLSEAEDVLVKGIMLASRNNFTDIKYSMQHLQARIAFTFGPKMALKQLDKFLSEAETLDIPGWIYNFRFLRSSMLSDPSTSHDDHAAIMTLQKITNYATDRRDYAMSAVSSLMEAMLILLQGVEGIEAAQRAIARAISTLNSGVAIPPQLEVLMAMLDISCSIMAGQSTASEAKVKRLHSMLDQEQRWVSWRLDGVFEIPVNPARQGRPMDVIRLRWLNKDDVFTLGYFLSGLCKFQRNVEEAGKGERFMTEGLKTIDRFDFPKTIPISLASVESRLEWKKRLKVYMRTYQVFMLCVRADWDGALRAFPDLQSLASTLPESPPHLHHLLTYLHATILHGTNSLPAALNLYQSLFTALPAISDLSLASKLSSILILRPHDPTAADNLLKSIEPLCAQHRNENIRAAYITIKATERTHPSPHPHAYGLASPTGETQLVKTKNYLSMALNCAGKVGNQQLTWIVLCFMCDRFFKGVVSEQAEKSAKAAYQNAKKGRDGLWALMSGEMYADCLARKGSDREAEVQRQINDDFRRKVFENLTRHMPKQEVQQNQHQHQHHQQQPPQTPTTPLHQNTQFAPHLPPPPPRTPTQYQHQQHSPQAYHHQQQPMTPQQQHHSQQQQQGYTPQYKQEENTYATNVNAGYGQQVPNPSQNQNQNQVVYNPYTQHQQVQYEDYKPPPGYYV